MRNRGTLGQPRSKQTLRPALPSEAAFLPQDARRVAIAQGNLKSIGQTREGTAEGGLTFLRGTRAGASHT